MMTVIFSLFSVGNGDATTSRTEETTRHAHAYAQNDVNINVFMAAAQTELHKTS